MSVRRSAAISTCVAWCLVFDASPATSTAEDAEIRGLLDRMQRVATLYRDSALQFTCDEKIVLSGSQGGGFTRKYRYVYVRDEAGRLLDYRSSRRGKGPDSVEQIDMKMSDLPSYVLRAYSSVFLFDEGSQEQYRYEILERGKALGRPAIKVGFSPTSPGQRDPDRWHGAVWVDGETYQLLRFEGVEHEDFEKKRGFEEQVEAWKAGTRRRPWSVEFQQVSTEFGVEKNGMRFPSKVTIVATLLFPPSSGKGSSKKFQAFKVTQTYTNYQFYGVHTWEQVERIVFAE